MKFLVKSSLLKLSIGAIVASSYATAVQAQQTTEMYYIFDIKTEASAADVGYAITKGLKKNAPDMQTTTHLVMGKPPVEPKVFEIVDMSNQFAGSNLGGLMELARAQGGGAAFKTVKCDGAVWSGRFTRDISNQRLNVNTCLFPYQGGYSLNVYAQDTNKGHGGGLISRKLAGKLVEGVLGKPQKWTQKTFSRMRRKVFEHVGVVPVLVEGQPKMDFSFKDEPAAAPVAPTAAIAPAPAPAPSLSTPPAAAAPVAAAPMTAPVAEPAPAAPAVPAIDCTGLTDDQCMAKLAGN